jgi:glucose-6-phosphate 1-dehydrogenase
LLLGVGTRRATAVIHEAVEGVTARIAGFRIDHYLTAISSVQITVAEQIGIGTRVGYHDRVGALRDMVPNHMLQLLSPLCMEPPVDPSADSIRGEKAKVLKAVKPPAANAVVRARYGPGLIDGKEVPGYLEEPDVPSGSRAEIWVAEADSLLFEGHTWRAI